MAVRTLAIVVVVLAAAALGIWVAVAQLTSDSASNPTDESVDAILSDIDAVNGKSVAVEGDVKVIERPWALLLGSSDATQVGLVVVAKERLPSSLRVNTHVNVVGTGARFSLAELERDHPAATMRELERSILRRLNGHPAIVDARVIPTPA